MKPKILALAGSPRTDSFNKKLVRVAAGGAQAAGAEVTVLDLRDLETKQIVKNPNVLSNHGATFVTPDTDYVIETTQYATPLGWEYSRLSGYE